MNKKITTSTIIILAGILIMWIAFFCPYLSATDGAKKLLDSYGLKQTNLSIIDMAYSSSQLINYASSGSLLKYLPFSGIILLGIFSLLNVIFSVVKKPVAVIVFDILSLVIFLITDLNIRGNMAFSKTYYSHSFAYYIFYLSALIVFVGAIGLLKEKRKAKVSTAE